MGAKASTDTRFLREALRLARQGYGTTSPNPTVGAVLVKAGKSVSRGRTAPAGGPHAEIGALHEAKERGQLANGVTLYVTLEPCCTHGRTPPCTDAIIAAGIRRVVVGTIDPNPKHAGKGLAILRRAGIEVALAGPEIASACARLNEPFNHWIIHRTPLVTVKAAMTLDGKIATATGESKWITGDEARNVGMHLRAGSDAILVGVNTVLADDPSLTVRTKLGKNGAKLTKRIRRLILDSCARTPLDAKVVTDGQAAQTTIVVSNRAPATRVRALAKRVNVMLAPTTRAGIDLRWLLKRLGEAEITSLLVEGGGEVNASFLLGGFAQRVAFFYAPKILGGRNSRKAVGGEGIARLADVVQLSNLEWRKLGADLMLSARVEAASR